MSTPDQPDTPPLTRRQLRELRHTGATPIIVPDDAAPGTSGADEADAAAPDAADAGIDAPVEEAPAPVAPLPRAAEEPTLAAAPTPDAHVDLAASPLTRRQAREQERIRTASVPVITADDAAVAEPDEPADDADGAADAADGTDAAAPDTDAAEADERSDADGTTPAPTDDFAFAEAVAEDETPTPTDTDERRDEIAEASIEADTAEETDEDEAPAAPAETPAIELTEAAGPEGDADADQETPAVVAPDFGRELLTGRPQVVTLPPSFDQLISRSSTASGSSATPNALILSQTPSVAPLVGPVTATGEVLVTGSFDLPAGLASVGHAHGTADGKEIDVSLIDGELPPASSPTPIAASAAVSTVKSADEIIRPPAPEKGSRLAVILGIVAGALALGLIGVLIVALTTGVWS